MKFDPPLRQAILLRRYKRFLADIETPEGERITIHCPNTGSMLNCQDPGSRVWYSTVDNPKRKYPNTWELVETRSKALVGVNTARANQLVEEALNENVLDELAGYSGCSREVPFGEEKSRIDFLLTCGNSPLEHGVFVEVKNVSLGTSDGTGLFPDAVTARGQKHLRELIHVAQAGNRAVLLFCVQHSAVEVVVPADEIDPVYGALLREAADRGVELLAYKAVLSPDEIRVSGKTPVRVD